MATKNGPIPQTKKTFAEVMSWTHESASLVIGDILGSAKRGDIWPDNKGNDRLIVFIDRGTSSVWFLMGTEGYSQSWEGFQGDVGVGNIQKRTAAGMAVAQKLIETEMQFLQGFLGAIYAPMWIALTGKDIVVFIIKYRKDFPKWAAAGRLFLLGRKILKKHAPTLYNTLFDTAVWGFVKGLPSAADEIPVQDAAKIFGSITGGVSKIALRGTLTLIKGFLGALRKTITGSALPLPKARLKQYSKPLELYTQLRNLKTALKPETVEIIKREYQANPITVANALRYLVDGLFAMSVLVDAMSQND